MGKMNPLEKCEKCPDFIFEDVQNYIQQLEAQNAELVKQVEQLKADKKKIMESANILSDAVTRLERERDAAIRDCARFPCYTCKERENGDFCPQCRTMGTFRALHEWRGPCEENGGLPEPPKGDT